MNLEEKVKEVLGIIGIIFSKDPDEMSADEVREAYKKQMIFIIGVIIGNILTTDKLNGVLKKGAD